MSYVSHASCMVCGKVYEKDHFEYLCPDHGSEGVLQIGYDYDLIAKEFTKKQLAADNNPSILRYSPLLPIEPTSKLPPLMVGNTPLLHFSRLAQELGVADFHIKDDSCLPTGSLKDRASVIAVVRAKEQQAKVITTASTGNAAAALSGICASVGQPNVIFVPAQAPQAKIVQLLIYGSRVVLVEGTYDDAVDLCMQAAGEFDWYNRTTGYNPYMTEGKKTCAFEIGEQLQWQIPDALFVSVGDGCIIGALHKGFKELYRLGWIEKVPKLFGVQAKGSNFLAQAWERGEDVITKAPIKAQTVADSISAGLPRDRIKALQAVEQTGGAYLTVSDEEILQAVADLATKTGVFAEPAAAAAWAGVQKAAHTGIVGSRDRVVLVNTGSGLKDIQGAMRSVESMGRTSVTVAPTMAALHKITSALGPDLT